MKTAVKDSAISVKPPKTVGELMAMALALEREAAARYDELAEEMVHHGNHELAALFNGLGAEERKHEARIGRLMGPDDGARPPVAFQWRSPEAMEREAKEEAGGVYLMTPYRALCLAVQNEERAFAFFSQIAGGIKDRSLREAAEALAKEELEHIVRLRLERCRAWRAESESAARRPREVRSLTALRRRAQTIEGEAALRYEALGQAMAARGDKTIGTLFRNLAADQRNLVAEIDRRAEGTDAHVAQATELLRRLAETAPHDALRLALADAEEAFDFYAAMAEQGADQDMVEEAQRLAARARQAQAHPRPTGRDRAAGWTGRHVVIGRRDHAHPPGTPRLDEIGEIPENLYREPLEVIYADHFRALVACRLLSSLALSEEGAAAGQAARIRLYLERDLPIHLADEEEDLFPLLRQRCADPEKIDGLLTLLSEEHEQNGALAGVAIEYLGRLAAGEGQHDAIEAREKTGLFSELQRRHLVWENSMLLPLARRWLAPEDMGGLGRRMAARHGVAYLE